LLLGIIFYLQSFQNAKKAVTAGFFWLFLGFFQPLTIVTGWALIFTHIIILGLFEFFSKNDKTQIDWNRLITWLKRACVVFLISLPFVVYNYFEFALDPYLSQWYKQNLITSPPVPDYLLAFGVLIPIVLVGVYYLFRKHNDQSLFLLGWVLAFPFLAYAPYNLQRRLPDGIWVGLVVLALIAIDSIDKKYRRTLISISSISILPTIIILAIGFFATVNPRAPAYIPNAEVLCFNFISQNITKNEVFLASYNTSNPLPAWAPVRVVSGLGTESANAAELDKDVLEFYQPNTSDQNRITLLKNLKVNDLIWGPEERKLGSWNPGNSSYLTKLYDQQNYAVYKVVIPEK
jgi:hypothetical protein